MPAPTNIPARRRQPRWSRRAVSLIEVVMASLLLAIIASAVVGGIATVVSGDARNQQKLEALEIANRLLLQYLDDRAAMPKPERQIEQGRGVYRWNLREAPVTLTTPIDSVVEKPTEGPGLKTLNKLVMLSVSVYNGVPDGMGGFTYGERICTLTRAYHPLSVIYRNPDLIKRLGADPGRMMNLMLELIDEGTTSRTDPSRAAAAGGDGGAPGAGRDPSPPPSGGRRESGPPAPRGGEIFSGARTGKAAR